jgi:hypothetical protein
LAIAPIIFWSLIVNFSSSRIEIENGGTSLSGLHDPRLRESEISGKLILLFMAADSGGPAARAGGQAGGEAARL